MFTIYPLILFVTFLILYIWLQFFSLWFEKNYSWMLVIISGQAITGFWSAYLILLRAIILPTYIGYIVIVWSFIMVIIFLIKYLYLNHLQIRKPKFITRVLTTPGVNYNEISVLTSDNVKIAGIHINNNHKNVIIISHGGSRCKNSFENIGWAQWLSVDYDVITYDTRGHFESGGYWTGDGKTKLDLFAIIEFAKSCGYEKIGVLGRSLGGWTSMLLSSEIKDISCLVVVSGVLGHIRSTPMVSAIEGLKSAPGRVLIRALQGLRYHEYSDNDTLTPKEIASNITVPVLLIYSSDDPVIGVKEQDVVSFYENISSVYKKYHIYNEKTHLPDPWHLGPIYKMSLDWFKWHIP